MPYLFRVFLVLSFLVPHFIEPVLGQKVYHREMGFQNDNDVYLMRFQDQYYTNGINFYYKEAIDSSKFSEKFENKLWKINIGHKIFNASNGSVLSESEVDRPLTGYLYVSGELHWYTKKEEVISLGTEIAVIGDWAFGENLQRDFHSTFGFYDITGWEYQLNSSSGIDLRASYSRLLFRNKSRRLDAFLKGDLSLGLNNTRFSVSSNFRWGRINSLFESAILGSRIQSGANNPIKEVYFYYRPQIHWVLYNSTIQGGMLLEDKGPIVYDVKPLIFSQVFGLQVASKRIGVNLNYTFNSEEIKSNATSHQYGTINVAYYF